MASFFFAIGDLVDIHSQPGVWRCARIKELDSSQGYYVSFVGFHEDRDVYVAPQVCRPFRTMTCARTWNAEEMEALPYEVNGRSVDFGRQLLDWINGGRRESPTTKVLIEKYRGDLFFLVSAVLQSTPQSVSEAKTQLSLIEDYIGLLGWWLRFARSQPNALAQTLSNPEYIYSSTEHALVSMHPELLCVFTDVFANVISPFWLVSLHTESTHSRSTAQRQPPHLAVGRLCGQTSPGGTAVATSIALLYARFALGGRFPLLDALLPVQTGGVVGSPAVCCAASSRSGLGRPGQC